MYSNKKLKILIVEDSAFDYDLISKLLLTVNPGFSIAHADTLKKGLENISCTSYDAILLDLSLPDSEGPQTLKAIRRHDQKTPVVVLTGYGNDEMAIESLKQGAQDFLPKNELTGNIITRSVYYSIERKKAEDKAEQAVLEWQTTFDAVNDAILLLDNDQRILQYNIAAKQLFKTDGDCSGKYCWEVMHCTIGPIPDCPVQIAIKTQHRVCSDIKIGNKWFMVTGDPVPDEEGQLVSAIHIMRDITERKLAEAAIRESEKRYRTLLESSSDIIFITDYNDKTVFSNIALEKHTGYSINDFNRKDKGFNFVYPDDYELVNSFINSFKTGKEQFSKILESRFLKNNGEIRWHSTIISKVEFDGMEALQFICRDITEQKRSENELKEKEDFNFTMFQYNPIAIIVVDIDGRVIKTNKKQVIFGSSNPKTGDIMYKEYARNHSIDMYAELMQCMKSGMTKEFPDMKYHRRFLDITIAPFIKGAIITCIDVTGRKRTEEEIRRLNENLELKVNKRSEELAEANRLLKEEIDNREKIIEQEKQLNMLKSRFISVVSHEFRTPLTGIQSSVQLIEFYGHKWDEEKKNAHFKNIYKTIRYTDMLLDDVSFLGKDDLGKINLNVSPAYIEAVCAQTISDVQAIFGDKFKINFCCKPNIINALVDEAVIRHILNNLLTNAVKYSGESGSIDFSVKTEDSFIVFFIKDNGIGISENDQKYIFDTFYRASNVETIKGTGLGLSIVKRCVDMHKGSINIESELNKGTCVTVKIPFVAAE